MTFKMVLLYGPTFFCAFSGFFLWMVFLFASRDSFDGSWRYPADLLLLLFVQSVFLSVVGWRSASLDIERHARKVRKAHKEHQGGPNR